MRGISKVAGMIGTKQTLRVAYIEPCRYVCGLEIWNLLPVVIYIESLVAVYGDDDDDDVTVCVWS